MVARLAFEILGFWISEVAFSNAATFVEDSRAFVW